MKTISVGDKVHYFSEKGATPIEAVVSKVMPDGVDVTYQHPLGGVVLVDFMSFGDESTPGCHVRQIS